MEFSNQVRPYQPADYETVAAWHALDEAGAAVVEDWFDRPGSVRTETDLAATLARSAPDGQPTSFVHSSEGDITAIGSIQEARGRAYISRMRIWQQDMPTARRLYQHMATVLQARGYKHALPIGTADDRDRLYRHAELRGDFMSLNSKHAPQFKSESDVLWQLGK